MSADVRTVITFESSAFNYREPREYFINPCCYGDDLAEWLRSRLEAAGIKCGSEIGQEDFGWYMDFVYDGKAYGLIVGCREEEQSDVGHWVVWLEPLRRGFMSMFQPQQSKIDPSVLTQLQAVLSVAPEISRIRWHAKSDFDKNREELGAPHPFLG